MTKNFFKIIMIMAIASLSQVDMSVAGCAGKNTLEACRDHCAGAPGANVAQCVKDNCTDCQGFKALTFCGYIGDPSDKCINLYKRLEAPAQETEQQKREREEKARKAQGDKAFEDYLLGKGPMPND